MCYLWKIYFKIQHEQVESLKMNIIETLSKKVGVPKLISDKVEFITKKIIEDSERHYEMIKSQST